MIDELALLRGLLAFSFKLLDLADDKQGDFLVLLICDFDLLLYWLGYLSLSGILTCLLSFHL